MSTFKFHFTSHSLARFRLASLAASSMIAVVESRGSSGGVEWATVVTSLLLKVRLTLTLAITIIIIAFIPGNQTQTSLIFFPPLFQTVPWLLKGSTIHSFSRIENLKVCHCHISSWAALNDLSCPQLGCKIQILQLEKIEISGVYSTRLPRLLRDGVNT